MLTYLLYALTVAVAIHPPLTPLLVCCASVYIVAIVVIRPALSKPLLTLHLAAGYVLAGVAADSQAVLFPVAIAHIITVWTFAKEQS